MKQKILFVCIHNSARSQMAEAFVNQIGGDHYAASSAGLEPGTLNPFVIEVLREKGLDISGKQTRGVADVLAGGETFDIVVTVCDEASAERCPLFPGGGQRLHWVFPIRRVLKAAAKKGCKPRVKCATKSKRECARSLRRAHEHARARFVTRENGTTKGRPVLFLARF